MRPPGIEVPRILETRKPPGPPSWQPGIITTILRAHCDIN